MLNINYIITPQILKGDKNLNGIISSLNKTIASLQPDVVVENIGIEIEEVVSFKSKFLVVVGKNALEFVLPIISRYPNFFTKIFIFQVKGYAQLDKLSKDKIEIFYLDHPIPSVHNFNSTKNFLETIISQEESCYFHFIITGGTSSCIVSPETTLSIDQYIETTKILLMDNIDIFAFNEIRSTIDSIKGGKLSRVLENHRVHTDIISDVFNNNPSYVGSGPTIPGIILNQRSRIKLIQIAEKLSYSDLLGDLESKLLETSKYVNENHTWSILASNDNFCNILQQTLQHDSNGFESHIVDIELNQEAKLFADYLFTSYKDLKTSSIYIWAGELRSSIAYQLKHDEKGGRLSLFAFYAALNFRNTDDVNIIAFATDGKDGSSPQSCYYINGETYGNLLKLSISDLVSQQYNMGDLFQQIGYSFETKLTNINYADIIILVKN